MKTKPNSAIALILSVGVLAILVLITVGFSAFTRLELQATENQINLLKASFIAQAGIARAVADIKYDSSYGAMNEPYDSSSDPWYYPGNAAYDGSTVELATAVTPSYGADISYAKGSYRLKVIDCGGLININCPLPNSDAVTDLEDILDQLGLTANQAQNLVAFRQTLPGQVFTTKEEIKLVFGIGKDTYNSIKDFITLWGDEDDGIIELDKTSTSPVSGHSRKSFVNVNTAPLKVLEAVFRLMMGSFSNSQADALAAAIKARRDTNPFDGQNPTAGVFNFLGARGEFERYLEYACSVGIITEANRDAVLLQSDPNTYATNSTKIGFDANGYYEIEAIGKYQGAKKRIKQVVSVFRKINQTTREEFIAKANLLATCRISWKDTCPVDFTVLKKFNYKDDKDDGQNPKDFIPDSLKLGFWDNFQEDYDPLSPDPDGSGQKGPWKAVHETYTINDGNDGMLRTWISGTNLSDDHFPKINLDQDVCIVNDFAIIVHGKDENNSDNAKYPVDRPNLPWPAIPLEWVWIEAPPPDATNCPDIAADTTGILGAYLAKCWKSTDPAFPCLKPWIHQQYINTFHVRFGNFPDPSAPKELMSSIFCNNVQERDQLTDSIPVYQNWVNYDGNGYIYFTPSPDYGSPDWEKAVWQTSRKPYSVIRGSNVMVSCNEYSGSDGDIPYFTDDSVEYFLIVENVYQDEKTFHLKGIGRWHTRGEVYFKTATTTSFITTHQIMVWEDRFFQFTGMGNLPDVDYIRIVPSQGVYTSQMFSPAAGMGSGQFLEWGTIQAHVTLPVTADPAIDDADAGSELVYLAASDSAVLSAPLPAYVPPVILPSGGPIGTTASQSICYQVYLFSDFGKLHGSDPDKPDNPDDADFEQAPVVEDVTITYLPKTRILYYNAL
ncbi:MAG: general secretion pathway protein GspK [Candidatus Omnitrophica bacterium]|nr:general secretion pathway protein GspK [Candidatus Omnitrophota bacterium]